MVESDALSAMVAPESNVAPTVGEVRLGVGVAGWAAFTVIETDGLVAEVGLKSGHVAEDLTKEDQQRSVLGSLSVPAADICGLTVEYGRFDPDESEQSRPEEVEARAEVRGRGRDAHRPEGRHGRHSTARVRNRGRACGGIPVRWAQE